jgi:protein TonB
MSPNLFTWAVVASLATHLVALATATVLSAGHGGAETQPSPVPIEVVRVEPEPPPPPPPREVPRKTPRLAPPVTQKKEVVENRLATPPKLLDDSSQREPKAPSPPEPEQRILAGNAMARPSESAPALREGGEAGAGRLFATGDIPVQPGRGTAGGSGAQGRGGIGLASRGGAQVEAGGSGAGTLTSLARPLGGYQHMPAYPESARRQGVEGVTTLRFQVHTDGSVTEMAVVRSAGHPDLDEAALEAVMKWRFEPARRGKDAVVVWVTLPVRFELKSQ